MCPPEANPHPAERVEGPERPADLVVFSALLVLVLVVTAMSVQTGGLPRPSMSEAPIVSSVRGGPRGSCSLLCPW